MLTKRFTINLVLRTFNPSKRSIKITSVVLVAVTLLLSIFLATLPPGKSEGEVDAFVGIDIGYGDDADVRRIVDKAEGYVNLVILGSLQLTTDTQKLTETCDYLYQKGMYFIIYVGYSGGDHVPSKGPDAEFFTMAASRWGDRFLGVYLFDEVGGKQIDQFHPLVGPEDNSTDSSDAAINYVHHLNWFLGNMTEQYSLANFTLYTSDYALNWFDYISGYDVVFTEFAGNNSRQIAIALGRGAARSLGKDWGVMLTWKYDGHPFMASADQLYDEMVLAYQNGANYIVVFNSPENFTKLEYGGLADEHLRSIQKFWEYAKNTPRNADYLPDAAFVLPRDYGYGYRSAYDRLWGLWEADELAKQIWNNTNNLLAEYSSNLDIVYETKIDKEPVELPYDKLIYWNAVITNR